MMTTGPKRPRGRPVQPAPEPIPDVPEDIDMQALTKIAKKVLAYRPETKRKAKAG